MEQLVQALMTKAQGTNDANLFYTIALDDIPMELKNEVLMQVQQFVQNLQ